jgi:hypothetical protein
MYLFVNVFLDLFHHTYFFLGTRKMGSRAPDPAHAFHSWLEPARRLPFLVHRLPLHLQAMPLSHADRTSRNQLPNCPERKDFYSRLFFSLSQNRRQIILRAGTNRFAGSEPETQRSPSLPHLRRRRRRRRRRNKEEAGAEDCRRSGGARGASEREKLLQAAGVGRGRGGGRDLGGITRAGTAAGEGVPLDADSPSGILNVSRISRWRGASRSRAGRRLGFGGRRDGGELGGRTGRGWRLLRRRRHLAGDHRLGAPEEWLVVAWQDPGARRAPAVSDHVSEDWYTGQAPWPGGRKRVSFCSRLCLPIIFSSP